MRKSNGAVFFPALLSSLFTFPHIYAELLILHTSLLSLTLKKSRLMEENAAGRDEVAEALYTPALVGSAY